MQALGELGINMSIENYKYKGVPLTPNIAGDLIIEIFAGQTKLRNEIVDAVVEAHVSRGGKKSNAQNIPRTIKKALENLRKNELVTNPSTGYWSISGVVDSELNKDESVEEEADNVEGVDIVNNIKAIKTFGEGSSSVYVYYYPTYKKFAEINESQLWECKVGMSERDPILRVLSQTGTALPELPTLALLIKTNEPRMLESTLHGILTLKNRKLPDSPGSEWFKTNPSEIEELLTLFEIT